MALFSGYQKNTAQNVYAKEQIFAPAREEVKKILEEQSAQKKQENKSEK